MRIRRLDASHYRRMVWKNGGGITTEVARSPAAGDDFDWRISIAEIAQDGDFSIFPEVDRELMLLDGGGIELLIGSEETVVLDTRYRRHAFPGEAPVSCRLLDGPTRDFNVMVRRGRCRAELLARTIVGAQLLFPAAATSWLIHVANGEATCKDRPDIAAATAGDTLLIEFDQRAAQPLVLNGSGEWVMVKLVDVVAEAASPA